MGCISTKNISPPHLSTNDNKVKQLNHELLKCTYDNTKPYHPNFIEGKCIRVYDGDTIHIAALMEGKPRRFCIRMFGYDSPELRTKNPEEKIAALKSKNILESRILNKIVKISIQNVKEKYGRILAIISDDSGEINKWMIDNGFGKPYFGGTKEEFHNE
jgi:endonuclease YncB( thermonuclease family)